MWVRVRVSLFRALYKRPGSLIRYRRVAFSKIIDNVKWLAESAVSERTIK